MKDWREVPVERVYVEEHVYENTLEQLHAMWAKGTMYRVNQAIDTNVGRSHSKGVMKVYITTFE